MSVYGKRTMFRERATTSGMLFLCTDHKVCTLVSVILNTNVKPFGEVFSFKYDQVVTSIHYNPYLGQIQ